ncbi:MAG: chromate transporter, partial [Pseudomonadota bacterium]
IAVLTGVYALYGEVPLISAIFVGVKAAVIAIVFEALIKVSRRALHSLKHWALALCAFLAIFFFAVPFPLIIGCAAILGYIGFSQRDKSASQTPAGVSPWQTLRTACVWLVVWWLPLLLVGIASDREFLIDIGLFFSRLAVVTFGGAYAVLAYLGQDVVTRFQWLTTGEMMDGLGLAETTPGPLILVNEFVGFLAGYHSGGLGLAIVAACVTLWATFAPCFLWIFCGAPYLEWICAQSRLRGALEAITAAVVGVILNLSVWFSLHVFFAEVIRQSNGSLVIWMPTLDSIDLRVVALATVSAVVLFWLRWGVLATLAIAGCGGLLLSALI